MSEGLTNYERLLRSVNRAKTAMEKTLNFSWEANFLEFAYNEFGLKSLTSWRKKFDVFPFSFFFFFVIQLAQLIDFFVLGEGEIIPHRMKQLKNERLPCQCGSVG